MKQTAKPKTLLVVLLYLIVIGTVAVKVIFFPKSPLEKLQSRFDYSLKGLDIKIEKLYAEAGFTDSWSIYSVSVNGDSSGTLFDEVYMQKGFPELQKRVIDRVNRTLAGEGKAPVFVFDSDQNYRYRMLRAKGTGHFNMYVICTSEDGSYYVICDS